MAPLTQLTLRELLDAYVDARLERLASGWTPSAIHLTPFVPY